MTQEKLTVQVTLHTAGVAMIVAKFDPLKLELSPRSAQEVVDQLAEVGIRACVPADSTKFSEYCKRPRVETRDVDQPRPASEAEVTEQADGFYGGIVGD